MTRILAGLPTICPLTADDVHLVIVGASDDVGRNLGNSPRSSVELTWAFHASVLVALRTIADEWQQDAWEL